MQTAVLRQALLNAQYTIIILKKWKLYGFTYPFEVLSEIFHCKVDTVESEKITGTVIPQQCEACTAV